MRIEQLISRDKKKTVKISGKNWALVKIRCSNCKKIDTWYTGSYPEVESYIFNTNKVYNQKCKNCGVSGQFEYVMCE
jgi:formate dehydrogenase maturation protein FdhE